MKTLVIYDSQHGHTQRVAQAIGEALTNKIQNISKVSPAELAHCQLWNGHRVWSGRVRSPVS
jgi:flavodoxin